MHIHSVKDMEIAARKIYTMGCGAVVVKGGHAVSDAHDVLFDGEKMHHFVISRIDTKNTHGTGCTFSAAITPHLAHGVDVYQAVERAKHMLLQESAIPFLLEKAVDRLIISMICISMVFRHCWLPLL